VYHSDVFFSHILTAIMMSYAQFLSAVLMLSVIFAFSFQTVVYISLLELLQFIGFVLFSKINTATNLTTPPLVFQSSPGDSSAYPVG